MSARIFVTLLPAAVLALAGCSTSKRIYSAEREEGRCTSLDWRIGEKIEQSRWDPESSSEPPLAANEAIRLANDTLGNFVKTPSQWSLAYCKIVEFQKGCCGYSVRFDRKGSFDDAQASDRFLKFYVLFDKSVIVPTVSYDR